MHGKIVLDHVHQATRTMIAHWMRKWRNVVLKRLAHEADMQAAHHSPGYF